MQNNSFSTDDNTGEAFPAKGRGRSPLRSLLWVATAVILVAAGIALYRVLAAPPPPPDPAANLASATGTLTALPSYPTPDLVFAALTETPVEPLDTPTGPTEALVQPGELPPGFVVQADEQVLKLSPAANTVGWVSSSEARGNHFGDSFLHSGVYNGDILHGALQFDLSRVPRGAILRYAALQLTGLDESRLDRASGGAWEVRWLAPEINQDWSRHGFQEIHNAAVLQSIVPPIGPDDLAYSKLNVFEFSVEQLKVLQKAIVDEQTQIAFRLDGPATGSNTVFGWDTGYGPATIGAGPKLVIVTGPAPATPPPVPTTDFIVVTSTPTPENVLTAAAIVERATAQAAELGTATPTPPNLVTATPTPVNQQTAEAQRLLAGLPPVVTNTPTPAGPLEATRLARYATAVAMTTGTFTPTPPNLMTATPTPTFVVVTNTPTPSNASAALVQAIAEATRLALEGPPTPFPPWIITATPDLIVVPPWPTPENAVTAEYIRVYPTIAALTIGTLTPTPPNLATATFTPQPTAIPLLVAMTSLPPTPTFTPQPGGIPDNLRGKLVYRSDNMGPPQIFVLDPVCVNAPEGCSVAGQFLLTQEYPHRLGWEQEAFSPDRQAQVIVQKDGNDILQILRRDVATGQTTALTTFSQGASYDPVWSPRGDKIAFVSTEAGNDEIYTINPDGTGLQRLTFNNWEWDKHPTWSPDGSQIVFHSNRDSGRRQLWVMNADGSGQRLILNSLYNDWDPVWIK